MVIFVILKVTLLKRLFLSRLANRTCVLVCLPDFVTLSGNVQAAFKPKMDLSLYVLRIYTLYIKASYHTM